MTPSKVQDLFLLLQKAVIERTMDAEIPLAISALASTRITCASRKLSSGYVPKYGKTSVTACRATGSGDARPCGPGLRRTTTSPRSRSVCKLSVALAFRMCTSVSATLSSNPKLEGIGAMVAATSRCGRKQCYMPPTVVMGQKCTGLGALGTHFPNPDSIRDRKTSLKFNLLDSLPKVTNWV